MICLLCNLIYRKEGSLLSHEQIVELDVRPTLEAGGEPFQEIMDTVKALREEDIFILHATFNPVPLLKVMEKKGDQNAPQ